MTDRMFATAGDWALASDDVQWILLRRWKDNKWRAVSSVRSERDILARCMREKGTDNVSAAQLLSGLPNTYDQFKTLATARDAR